MKKILKRGTNGKIVVVLEPENEEDAAKIRELVRDKKIDGHVSFGDMRAEIGDKRYATT